MEASTSMPSLIFLCNRIDVCGGKGGSGLPKLQICGCSVTSESASYLLNGEKIFRHQELKILASTTL